MTESIWNGKNVKTVDLTDLAIKAMKVQEALSTYRTALDEIETQVGSNPTVETDKKLQIYIGGDMLKKGNQLQRAWEKEQLINLGFEIYSPLEDKEINDKANQSEEDNHSLSIKIFDKDTKAMLNADIIIFDVDNDNVGTTTEIGQWAMIHRLAKLTKDPVIQGLASKPIFFHNTDIRAVDIPEVGFSRSYSINQYLHGAVQEANHNGILTWDELVIALEKVKENHKLGFPLV